MTGEAYRRRFRVLGLGFFLGAGVGVLFDVLVDPHPFYRIGVFGGGVAGALLALKLGEKLKKIPTETELEEEEAKEFSEALHPLGLRLNHSDPPPTHR